MADPDPRPAPPPTAKGEVTVVELTRPQQVMGRRVAEAKATVPEFALRAEVDASPTLALLAAHTESPAPTFADAAVSAAARALRDVPRANGTYRDARWELYSRVNVGVAMAADDALVVPVVFDADAKALADIAREVRELAERVAARTITPPELSGGTFTVSALEAPGLAGFQAVLNGAQAGVLAVGPVRPAPVVRDGALEAGHVADLTLTCDHRILFGATAATFLGRIVAHLDE